MKQRITAIAIATVLVAAGLSVVQPAAAVNADCSEEFDIPDSEPTTSRILLANAEETGREDVKASSGDEEVTVSLDSPDDTLEFGVFYLDGQTCVKASQDGLSTCGGSETLDTHNNPVPHQKTCEIDAPTSGARDYFFHVANQEDDSLEYRMWESS